MKFEWDARFEEERERFKLRFQCEDCVRFVPETAQCAHGYPTDRHRRSQRLEVLFCKEFEL